MFGSLVSKSILKFVTEVAVLRAKHVIFKSQASWEKNNLRIQSDKNQSKHGLELMP